VLHCAASQVRHSNLLEQVQQLEVLRKENGEMAALVAQLQVLKNDQQHMQGLCNQVEQLCADNATLQRRSQTLPSLQAENERLKVCFCAHLTGMSVAVCAGVCSLAALLRWSASMLLQLTTR
jgi:cell shape-determining protein MreC